MLSRLMKYQMKREKTIKEIRQENKLKGILRIKDLLKENKVWIIFFIYYIVKLLASKLKSLPYNHTDHPPTYPPTHKFISSLYKSYINI